MKGIKIDVEKQKVYYIDIDSKLESIYNAIGNGCQIFTSPISYKNGDTMYCDDESLLNPEDIKGAFIYPDWNYPIVSNAIIMGTDEEGNSVDCKLTIEDVSYGIRFIEKENHNLINYINQFV